MPASPTELHAILIDDRPLFREGLKVLLAELSNNGLHLSIQEMNGLEPALDLLPVLQKLDLALVSCAISDGLATQLIHSMHRRFPDAPIAVLAKDCEPASLAAFFQIEGVRAVIKSGTPLTTLLSAMRLLLAGCVYVPEELLGLLRTTGLPYLSGHVHADRQRESPCLTPRQLEVLSLMLQGNTNRQIGEALDLSPGTVKNHVRVLLRLLGARSRTEAISLAQQNTQHILDNLPPSS